MRADVVEAAGWLWRARVVRGICVVALVTNLGSSMLLLPLVVLIEMRGGTPTTVGIVIGTASVGGLIGAMTAGRITANVPTNWLLLSVCIADTALIMSIIAPFGPYWPAFPIFLTGVFGPLLSIPLEVYLARHTPEHMMARVQSLISASFSVFVPLGPILGGILSEGIGPAWTIAVAASIFGVGVIAVCLTPALRRRDLLDS